MGRKKYLLLCLEFIFIFTIVTGGLKQLEKGKYLSVYDSDEVGWIFTAYYFNLYFLHFDLFHQDWKDYEAFDHPPLPKYIVGGVLFLKGYKIDSLEPKRFWNRIPINQFQTYFEFVKHEVPNPGAVIPALRTAIFLFALSALLLIYAFIRISYGILPAMVSTALIITNPIFNTVSTRILSDPILLFFFASFALLCGLYLKSPKGIYMILAFIVSSLAFSTKLNGILLVPVLIILFLIINKFIPSKQDWKLFVIGLAAFLLILIILNPVFLNSGIYGMAKMFKVRLSAFRIYQETFKHAALLSVGERFVAGAQMIFFEKSFFYQLIKIPLELIMFIVGIYYTLCRRDLFLILLFLFLVIIPLLILPFNLPRYYYWIFPFIHIIAGLSSNFFKETVKGWAGGWAKSQ